MSEKLSMNNKKRSWINQKRQEEESYPKTINFSARSLLPFPPSSPSCTQEGRSILERGVQNFPYLSPTVIKPFMYPWGKWSLQKEAHILLTTSPSPLPPPPSPPQHTHIHTHTRTHTRTHACAKPLIHPWVEVKFTERGIYAIISCMIRGGWFWSRGKFVKKLWCCVGGRYNKIIWFHSLNWKCKLATVQIC